MKPTRPAGSGPLRRPPPVRWITTSVCRADQNPAASPASHDDCLPDPFDDSIAHANDLRIQSLQAMLDLATPRGLQVIVLTCTPAHYVGLGAKETRLAQSLLAGPQAGSE